MKRFAAIMLVVGCVGGATDAFADPPAGTISVEGVATVGISKTASAAEANAAYRQGLAAAIADWLEKAQFLAGKTGANVGVIDQISEDGGSIGCVLHAETGPLYEYEPYEGARPHFGSVGSGIRVLEAAPAAAATRSHVISKKRKKKHKSKAIKAARMAARSRRRSCSGTCSNTEQIAIDHSRTPRRLPGLCRPLRVRSWRFGLPRSFHATEAAVACSVSRRSTRVSQIR
jgi:hypothetical protein